MEIVKKDKKPKHDHNYLNTFFWYYAIDWKNPIKDIAVRFYNDISVLSKLVKDKDFFNKIKGLYFVCIDVNGKKVNEFYIKPPFWISQRWHKKVFLKDKNLPHVWWEFLIRTERGRIRLSAYGRIENADSDT